MRRLRLTLTAALAIGLSGCLAGLGLTQTLLVNGVERSDPQSTVDFVNALGVEVCAINLWRDQGPVDDQTANWLELTDLDVLAPGQRATVGIVPRDAPYHLRAVACDGLVITESVVRVIAGQELVLRRETSTEPAGLPPSL